MNGLKNGKYTDIKNDILSLIDGCQIGDKLIPELTLCKKLDISRASLRRVLDELQSEKYIRRVQGSGTVILKKRAKYTLNLTNIGSASDLINGYGEMSTQYLKITEIQAGAEYAQRLDVGPDECLLNVERVRSLDGVPAIYTHNVLVRSRVDYHKNIYAEIANSLSKTMDWRVETCDTNIQICAAEGVLVEKLNVSPGTLLLLIVETARQQDGLPLDYSHDYYVADLFEFQITRTRKI